jgi:hypothetical protein
MARSPFNDSLQDGRELRTFLQAMELALDKGEDLRLMMEEMLSGLNANLDASYADFVTRFGFADNAQARAGYGEFAAGFATIKDDAQRSGAFTAIRQMLTRLR